MVGVLFLVVKKSGRARWNHRHGPLGLKSQHVSGIDQRTIQKPKKTKKLHMIFTAETTEKLILDYRYLAIDFDDLQD